MRLFAFNRRSCQIIINCFFISNKYLFILIIILQNNSKPKPKTKLQINKSNSNSVLVLTTWGNFPPTGIYEGTFGDIGSYHGCVNVPQNPVIGHAHYCTVAYRPVMPTRRNYELIVRKEPDELLKLFDRENLDQNQDKSQQTKYSTKNEIQSSHFNHHHNQLYYSTKDAFTDLLNNAQYSHYIYYKFGTCFPIQCTPFDVSKLAKLLGKRSILMSGPVKCHSKYEDDYEFNSSSSDLNNQGSILQISIKDLNDGIYIWKPHMTTSQFVSLLILIFLTSIMIVSTLIDTIINKLPKLYKEISYKYRKSIINHDNSFSSSPSNKISSFQARSLLNLGKNQTLNNEPKVFDQNNNVDSHELNKIHLLSKSSNSIDRSVSEYSKRDKSQAISLENNVIYNKHNDLETNKQQTKINQFDNEESKSLRPNDNKFKNQKQRSLFMDIIEDFSIITNAKQFFKVSQSQLKNDILCINGIRVCTMSWIITNHTMQYNDWSAFARTREIETHLKSLVNQPLFNGSYLVDTFFLMSGLLTSYSSFKSSSNVKNSKGIAEDLKRKFSTRSYLIGRYLRLTPQIMFVSILFILLPQLSRSGGPHWYTITGEYSENCSQNWWINLFHIQAFYHTNEMCNFVCWWISVDMFYHLFALMIILFILYHGHRVALLSCSILAISNGIIQAIKHYQLGLPPNLLSTIPQTGAMWSKMTLEFFWTPYAHAFPYFLGFYIGYLMAQRNSKLTSWFTINRVIYGWLTATFLLITLSYSTYFWVVGKWQYTRIESTIFHIVGPIIWSTCLGWIILACHYGYGSWLNQVLSCKLFIILGKASYIVYLSHFLVLFTFFGSQNLLLEPTQLVMFYVILGNICLSMLLGSVLCVVFEMPWLKTQRRLMKLVH